MKVDMAEEIIKNPARETEGSDTAEHKKYVPQYRILGVSPSIPDFPNAKSDNDEASFSPQGTYIPNVGNNMEHAWVQDSSNDLKLKNKEDKFVLLAKEEIIAIGSLEEIEDQIRKIFYKEHVNKKYNLLSIDDLTVFKKMKIKVGVFVE